MKIKILLILGLCLPALMPLLQDQETKSHLPQHFHQRLGQWQAAFEFYSGPGEIAFKAKGKQTNSLTCGGLWLESHLKADMGGQPFEGRGFMGYQEAGKQCTGTWIDSMSKHLMTQKGSLDATGKKLTMKTTVETQSGAIKPARLETEILNDKSFEFRMFILGGEKDFLSMKILYTKI